MNTIGMTDSIGRMLENKVSSSDNLPNEVAKDFESVFASLLIKEMRASLENGGFFEGESTDSLGGLFDLFVGKKIAEGSPLGISKLVAQSYQGNVATEAGSQQVSIKT